MTILSFIWLALLIVDYTGEMTPALDLANEIIWGLFILHFGLEFWIAPRKVQYLRKNWLTAIALVLPAFRVLRAFRTLRFLRAARVGRSVRLLRWMTSMNRGMKATRRAMRQRGFAYLFALTVIVCFAGAAGVYVFESPDALHREGLATSSSAGIGSYGEAVWWTAMMLTTMGSDYFPKTTEGRIIAWLLAVYGFAIFGYITATVAGLIVKVDNQKKPAATDSSPPQPTASASYEETLLALQRIELQLQEVRSALGQRRPQC
jgi:voltage-gated potassium channel